MSCLCQNSPLLMSMAWLGFHRLCYDDFGGARSAVHTTAQGSKSMVRAVAQEVLEAGTGDGSAAASSVGAHGELRAGVVPMSMHPYGCRVIQRILEHCTLPDVKAAVKTQVAPPS